VVTGAALARRAGADVELLTVAETPILPEAQTPPGMEVAGYENAFIEDARKKAAIHAREAGIDDASVVHVRRGLPPPTIAAVAEEREADIVVLGAHPRPAIARFLVGSTAERVIRLADRPILVAVEGRRQPFRRILVALDLSQHSRRVVRAAVAIARADGAAVRVLHAQEPLPPMVAEAEAFDPAEHRRHVRAQLQAIVDEAELPREVDLELRLPEGRAGDLILKESQVWDADLIVMGTHGFGLFERLLLGSTSTHILRHAHRATVVVPPLREGE
jgi:nucleotide-binding universal stress UspA family protein